MRERERVFFRFWVFVFLHFFCEFIWATFLPFCFNYAFPLSRSFSSYSRWSLTISPTSCRSINGCAGSLVIASTRTDEASIFFSFFSL